MLTIQEKELLQTKYGQKIADAQIAIMFNIPQQDLSKMMHQTEAKLEIIFLETLTIKIQDDLPSELGDLSQKLIYVACSNLRISETEWSNIEVVDRILDECLRIVKRKFHAVQ